MPFVRPGFVPNDVCASLVAAIVRAGAGPDARVLPKRVEIEGRALRTYPDAYEILTRLRAAAAAELSAAFPCPTPSYLEFTLLTEMKDGDAHSRHADSERRRPDGKWVPNHTPWRDCTAILYLNSSGIDYEGGVLRFTRRGETVIPTAGTLVGFTCGRADEHEVTPVADGSRFSAAIWTTLDPDFAEEWDRAPSALGRPAVG